MAIRPSNPSPAPWSIGSGRARLAVGSGFPGQWWAWCRHCPWTILTTNQPAAFAYAQRHRCPPGTDRAEQPGSETK